MLIFKGLLLFLPWFTVTHADPEFCISQARQKCLQQTKDTAVLKELGARFIPNDRYNFKNISDENLKKLKNYSSPSQELIREDREVFRKIKEAFSLSGANPQEIERLNYLQFNILDKDDPDCNVNGAPVWGLFYNSVGHLLDVCPLSLSLPKESLALVMAHEVSHLEDPCNRKFPLYSVKNFLKEFLRKTNCEAAHICQDLYGNLTMYPFIVPQTPLELEVLNEMVREKKAMVVSPPLSNETIKEEGAQACLAVKYPTLSEEKIQTFVNQSAPFSRNSAIDTWISSNPECFQLQAKEAFADWRGSLALGFYFKKDPQPISMDNLIFSLVQRNCDNKDQQGEGDAKHSSDNERLRTFFQNGDIAEALGCLPSRTASCLKQN